MSQPALMQMSAAESGWGGPAKAAPHILESIDNLPTLPNLLLKVMHTLDDERSSAWELERIVRHDQALSSKLLSVANSSYYGFAHQIGTVTRAVVVLGMSEVRKICLGAGLASLMRGVKHADLEQVESLWTRSLLVAETCRIIATRTRLADPEQAFTAGLLHDLGWLMLASYFADDLAGLFKLRELMDIPLREAEALLELDHEDLGLRLAEHWRLPPMLAEVMGRHHEPGEDLTYAHLVAMVHVADCLCREFMDSMGDYADYGPRPNALDCLSMDQGELWWIRKRLKKRAGAVASLRKALLEE